ncbi:MAG: ferredoxin--NADP reductase, partial [Burkholderiales bacterium]|nr:ferredoxin--NADP reductase [Burkholderiales bacterium]
QDLINSFYTHEYYGELVRDKLIYVKMLTREFDGADLYGRITELIKNGKLQEFTNTSISINDSRVMICGNPEMVDDTRKTLSENGLTVSKRGKPGNMAVENYW